jgi:allophanate hydrolase
VAEAFELAAGLDDPAVFISQAERDRALAELDESAPLAGMTLAVKDNIDVVGLPTTNAFLPVERPAAVSAPVVARLVAAGATVIGKTNMDQFATGLVGTRSPWGTPRNPLDASLVPGGSSSGSAVAVALGVVDVALGTDTAGSGRVPAAMCGIVGLKPTRGRLPTTGVVPAVRTVDCVSIFARGVGPAWAMLARAEGPDAGDPYSRARPPGAGADMRRVAIPRHVDLDSVVDKRAWEGAVARVGELGVDLVEVDLAPYLSAGELLYGGPWIVQRGLAFGDQLNAFPDAADPVVLTLVAGAPILSAEDVWRGDYTLAEARRRFGSIWTNADLLLVPTTPGPASVAEVRADPVGRNVRLGLYTSPTNLLDLCAVAVPTGPGARGVQIVGPAWADETAARLAARLLGEQDPSPTVPQRPATLELAVVGAHLSGLPLNHQLLDRGAALARATTTAACYRLFALGGFDPPRPGLVHVGEGGCEIEVEVWRVPIGEVGSFLAGIPAPLALGTVELADGQSCTGFVCEPRAMDQAVDVSAHGGWRGYLRSLAGLNR